MSKILIVEDEEKIARFVELELKHEGYEVDKEINGRDGLEKALNGNYDLMLLDIMIPQLNGLEVLRRLRRTSNLPVILLTARDEVMDKVAGLDGGADDYITKPFHIEELVARINVQLRKNKDSFSKNYLEVGDLKLDIKNYKLWCQITKDSINISCKEYLLIEYLMTNPNQIISKDQIYDKVWGTDTEVESNNLEAYLSFLRKKIKIIGSNVKIKAIRGLGYKLEVDHEKVTK